MASLTRNLEAADLHAAHDRIASIAAGIIDEGETLPPCLLLVTVHKTKPGDIEDVMPVRPEILDLFMRNAASKALLMRVIGDLLEGKAFPPGIEPPDIVVHVSEAWGRALAPEQAEAIMRDYKFGDVSKSADRRDMLLIAVHVPGRTYLQIHEIEHLAGGGRRVKLGPLNLDGSAVPGGMLSLNDGSAGIH